MRRTCVSTRVRRCRSRKSMDVAVVYPPRAYFYMPYMAPFLLKGHVEAVTAHRVTVRDLNIEYFARLWQGESNDLTTAFLDTGRRAEALLAELLEAEGSAAYAALRNRDTYDDERAVWRASRILRIAETLTSAHARWIAPMRFWPTTLGQWPAMLRQAQSSLIGTFYRSVISDFDRFDAVGVSVTYLKQFAPGLLLAQMLKSRKPDQTIIIGGNAVTHLMKEVLADDGIGDVVDYAIPYEGEALLGDLLNALSGEGHMPTRNVVRWDDGRATYEPDTASKLRIHARPDYTALVHAYPTPEPIIPLLTAKGCYWGKCKFCTHHEGYGQGYYRIDEDVLTTTLSTLLAEGHRSFYFVDEALPPRVLGRLGEVFDDLGSGSVRRPRWMAEARAERSFAQPASAELLAKSGCALLVNGIETGVQRVSDLMDKGIDLDAAARHARECATVGIRVGWMFFIGYPGETEAESRATFEFIEANAESVDYASVGVFSLERGSPLHLGAPANGITEIDGAVEPYRVVFAYAYQGTRVTPGALRERLRALHREFASLEPMFRSCGDRALMMFLPPKETLPNRLQLGDAARFEWNSSLLPGHIVYDAQQQRMEVHAWQPVAS